MLIPLSKLYAKYRIKATGVIHVGANTGQEYAEYSRFGMRDQIWVEAIPEVFKQLQQNMAGRNRVICLNACVSDVTGEEVIFNVANNSGQSSSFLELGTHATVHPEVKYVDSFKTTTIRMDDLLKDVDGYKFMAVDTQGSELHVLKGMGKLLDGIDYCYLEINRAELYRGCPMVEELDEYLFDFRRVETHWEGNTNWGDGFWIRKTLL